MSEREDLGMAATQVETPAVETPQDATVGEGGGIPASSAPEAAPKPWRVINVGGKEYPVTTEDEGVALMQQGRDYSEKMRELNERYDQLEQMAEDRARQLAEQMLAERAPTRPTAEAETDDPFERLNRRLDGIEGKLSARDEQLSRGEASGRFNTAFAAHEIFKNPRFYAHGDKLVAREVQILKAQGYTNQQIGMLADKIVRGIADDLAGLRSEERKVALVEYGRQKGSQAAAVPPAGARGATVATGEEAPPKDQDEFKEWFKKKHGIGDE